MSITFGNNAATTIAGAISNTSLTVAVAAGSGALFPQVTTASGNYFVMTFTDAATGLLREIVHCTNVSGDTLTIVRAQEGTTALNWLAGDLADNLWTAGSVGAVIQGARQLLTSNLQLFVNASTGNDSNSGTSSSAPLLTLQRAINILFNEFDLAGFTVTINCTGAFTAGVFLASFIPGSVGAAGIVFNFTTGSTVNNTGNNTLATFECNGGGFTIEGPVTISAVGTGNGGRCVSAADGGSITIGSGGVTFGACSTEHIQALFSGTVNIMNSYTVSGSSPTHIAADNLGTIAYNTPGPITVTLSGTPAFATAFSRCTQGFMTAASSYVTFTGAATGTRYLAQQNGVINTSGSGANFFPGSIAGSTNTGGIYA